jgi:hypothetical protein
VPPARMTVVDAYRRISGERRDLTRIREPAGVRALEVVGPRVRSLDGLQRLSNLKALKLRRLVAPNLEFTRGLDQLHTLDAQDCAGPFDCAPLEHLAQLALLLVAVPDVATAESIAALDLHRLARIDRLVFINETDQLVDLDPGWLARVHPGAIVMLGGFAIAPADIPSLAALDGRLERLQVEAHDTDQQRAIEAAFTQTRVDVPVFGPPPPPIEPLEVDGRALFVLTLDLAERWDLVSNSDAAPILERRLRRHHAGILDQVTFDADADWLWIYADERAPLEAILAFVDG